MDSNRAEKMIPRAPRLRDTRFRDEGPGDVEAQSERDGDDADAAEDES